MKVVRHNGHLPVRHLHDQPVQITRSSSGCSMSAIVKVINLKNVVFDRTKLCCVLIAEAAIASRNIKTKNERTMLSSRQKKRARACSN